MVALPKFLNKLFARRSEETFDLEPPPVVLGVSAEPPAAPPIIAQSGRTADTIEVSVVMPCLNEVLTLPACIHKIQETFVAHGIAGEVIVADNGSDDGSQELARSLGARVIDVAEKGYGSALMGGISAARGTFVVMGDADDSYDFRHVPRFLERLRSGDELVMGNRFLGGILPGAMPPLHKYFGNPVMTGFGRLFFGSPVRDFQCGLRGFRRDAILGLNLRTLGMEFASEMVVKATLHGLKIAEIPTTLSPDGRDRAPHMRSFRDGWRNLRFMLMYSPSWLFLYPGLLLILFGVLGYFLALPATTIRGVTFDAHTLLVASLAVMLGYQAIQFALFAKTFATTERLMPADPRLDRLFQFFQLEHGLAVGGLLFLAGMGLLAGAVWKWHGVGYGALDYSATMRLVIPGVTLAALGMQTMLSSFFLSILGLARK